jgi:hypothetical protein
MRWAIIALALLTAGCAAFPEEVRFRVPEWLRGQGFSRTQTPAQTPTTTTPASTPASASVAALSLPMGDFAAVHTAFSADVARRYPANMGQNAVVSDAQGQGFRCSPDGMGQQVCERLQPIGAGCEDVFVVTARSAGGGSGDVRRRCPIGQVAPGAQPPPTNLLGAPVGL